MKEKFFGDQQVPEDQSRSSDKTSGEQFSIDSVNPYALGRQARAAFDDLWNQVTRVAQPNRSYIFDDVLQPDAEESALYANTTVLVVGATGRVGRILTRKLLLRGYKVKALVRKRDSVREGADVVPEAVEIAEGDVGEIKDVQAAMRGVDKASPAAYDEIGIMHVALPLKIRVQHMALRRCSDVSRKDGDAEVPHRRSSSVLLQGAHSPGNCCAWRNAVS